MSLSSATAAQSLQLCLTPCDPIDGSDPGSSIPGILQARILDWVATSFSSACMHAKSPQSCPTLCDTIGSSPPGSSIHRILQARILEWTAVCFSSHCPQNLSKLENKKNLSKHAETNIPGRRYKQKLRSKILEQVVRPCHFGIE